MLLRQTVDFRGRVPRFRSIRDASDNKTNRRMLLRIYKPAWTAFRENITSHSPDIKILQARPTLFQRYPWRSTFLVFPALQRWKLLLSRCFTSKKARITRPREALVAPNKNSLRCIIPLNFLVALQLQGSRVHGGYFRRRNLDVQGVTFRREQWSILQGARVIRKGKKKNVLGKIAWHRGMLFDINILCVRNSADFKAKLIFCSFFF